MIVVVSVAVDCIVRAESVGATGLITTVVVIMVKDAPELGDTPLIHSVLPTELVV